MERTAELLAAMRALLAAQLQALVLRFRQELPNKKIGRIVQRTEGAVDALLHRALHSLHRRLAAGKNT
jgi:DNA-directed RNA polymerase specialized sigma24 family protein